MSSMAQFLIVTTQAGVRKYAKFGVFYGKVFRWLHRGYGGSHSTPEMFGNKEGATSTPDIFGKKHSFVLTFFTTNTIYVDCRRCKP